MTADDISANCKRIATEEAVDIWARWATKAALNMAAPEAAWDADTYLEALIVAEAAWNAAKGNDAAWDAAVAAAAVVYDTAARAVKT